MDRVRVACYAVAAVLVAGFLAFVLLVPDGLEYVAMGLSMLAVYVMLTCAVGDGIFFFVDKAKGDGHDGRR